MFHPMPLFGDWLVQFSIYYWVGFPFVARMELTAQHVYLHYEILLNKEGLIKLLQCWPMPWALPATPHDCTALGGTGMWRGTRGLRDGNVPRQTSAFPARHSKSLPATARVTITSSLPKISVHATRSTETSRTGFLTKRPWGHSVRTSVWSCLNPAAHSQTFLWNSWPQSLWFGTPHQSPPSPRWDDHSQQHWAFAHSQHFPGRCLSWRTQNPPCYSKRITLFPM